MKLIIVRHGETEWNKQDKAMGQLDSPLTAQGIQDAHAIAQRLSRLPFTTCYSSDLGRAAQTATIIAEICDITIVFDSDLREWNMGIFQRFTIPEMREKFPQERGDYERIGYDYVVPKGESIAQCKTRSLRALNRIAEQHLDEIVVVVTHGYVLMVFFEMVLGLPPRSIGRYKLNHASFSAFDYVDGTWSLVVWNDRSHLEKNTSDLMP